MRNPIKSIRSFYQAVIGKLRINFRTKLLCSILCFALIPITLLIIVTCHIYSSKCQRELEKHAIASSQLVWNNIIRYLDKATGEAMVIAKMQAINNAILNRKINDLQMLAFELKSAIGADVLSITDERGIVLAQIVNQGNPGQLIENEKISQTLIEGVAVKEIVEEGGNILLVATVPILNWVPSGTVTVGYLLDEAKLHSIKDTTGTDIIILPSHGNAISTSDKTDLILKRMKVRIEAFNATDTIKGNIFRSSIAGKQYQITIGSLGNSNSNVKLLIMVPIQKWWIDLFEFQYLLIGLVLILVPAVAFLAYRWGKEMTKPLYSVLGLSIQQYKENGHFDSNDFKKEDEFSIIRHAIGELSEKIKKSAHLAAIGQSTAMVAHDVRRPLTSMKALLSILPSIKDDPALLEKMTANVDQTITRTNAMLNEIMDFSRDATALELKECSPKVIFASAVSEALRNHPEADVEIRYELDSEHVFYCDVARVTRVFANLIDNALGAMGGKGRGLLRIKTHDEIKDDKRFIIAEVRDSGGGIPEEYLSKIFDPFFTKGKKGGTGLGLAICQKIANMHGGEIKAWNLPTIGAVFSVKIPAGTTREIVEDDEQDDLIHDSKELKVFRAEETQRISLGDTANTAEFMRISKAQGRISTLLVVDDEPLFRETIRSLLNTLGQVKDHVKVIEADSAEMGLKQFETMAFDYVIADIDLGRNKMNGYKLTQEILEKHPSTYVLIHSNRRRDEMDEKIRQACHPRESGDPVNVGDSRLRGNDTRFMGFLPKPMKTDELLQFLACKSFETASGSVAEPFRVPQDDGRLKPSATESSANPKTVLLLNDDTEFCFSMKCQLKSSAAQVLDVNNISDALKHISQNKVDAIISDINLGEGEPDGYEFLKHVREKDTQVPFYFMSGYNKSSEWPKAEKLGATGYFQLPFCIEDARKELEL